MVENLIYWYFALAVTAITAAIAAAIVAAIVAAITAVLVGLEILKLSCQYSG